MNTQGRLLRVAKRPNRANRLKQLTKFFGGDFEITQDTGERSLLDIATVPRDSGTSAVWMRKD